MKLMHSHPSHKLKWPKLMQDIYTSRPDNVLGKN